MNEPRAKPILFSGPMVKAILEGRKTQTRRIVNERDRCGYPHNEIESATVDGFTAVGGIEFKWPRRYEVGNRLWVKEGLKRGTWEGMPEGSILYAADDTPAWDVSQPCTWVWKRATLPSMYCPRGLSRIELKVTGIRVERLQAITEEDAKAEGCDGDCGIGYLPAYLKGPCRYHYASLWEDINGKKAPWETNPWVRVIEFQRVKPPLTDEEEDARNRWLQHCSVFGGP